MELDLTQAHHPAGPSAAYRRRECPGSAWLEAKARREGWEPPDEAITGVGTRLHRALETGELPEDEEEVELVLAAMENLDSIAPLEKWQKEVRLELLDVDGSLLCWGTADALILQGLGGCVWDSKFGYRIPDELFALKQVGLLGAMLMQTYPILRVCEAFIFYARSGTTSRMTIQRADVPGIVEWYRTEVYYPMQESWDRLDAGSDPLPTDFRAGEWCRWCRAKVRCPAHVQATESPLVKVEPKDLAEPEKLAEALRVARLLAPWCRAVEDVAYKRAVVGDMVLPGFRIESKPGNRTITNVESAWERSKDLLSVEEFLRCCTPRITGLEGTWAEKYREANGGTKTDAKAVFTSAMKGTIKRKADQKRLVQE